MFSLENILERMIWFIPVILSLTVHEWAHAWTAWKLGDDTSKMLGRVSLDPLVHLDPLGTLLPLMGFPIGWAKPVPVNPVRFRNQVSMSFGMLLTAAAGPCSNLLLAGLAYGTLLALGNSPPATIASEQISDVLTKFLMMIVMINVLLAGFNLIPIPPLDGSRIVEGLIPPRYRPIWANVSSWGPFLLLGILFIPALIGYNVLSVPLEWLAGELSKAASR